MRVALLARAVAAALAGVALAGCGGDGPKAAEPARAPAAVATPAGVVQRVGTGAEGIVYDPGTNTVAVLVRQPDRLLLLDADSLAVRRSVVLPGKARHLQLAQPGGPVLVPDETANLLIEVALPSGTTRRTKVGQYPHDAAAVAGGEFVVGNERGHSISFVRGGRVLATVDGPKQPGGVVGDGSRVAVIDVGAFTVRTYDVATRRSLAIVDAGRGPTHGVRLDGERLAVADTRGNALLLFTLNPLRRVAVLDVPGSPYGIAMDSGTVWLTLTARNELVAVDVSAASPRVVTRYPTVRQPNTVAVSPDGRRVWVTGAVGGVVQRIER